MEERDRITELLQSPEDEKRLQGLKVLPRDDAEFSLACIYRSLGDSSWRVRKEAADCFLLLPDASKRVPEVIALLHSEENAGQRNSAVEILVRIGPSAIPHLLPQLTCNDQDVRKFVLDILGEIGDFSCAGPMIHALRDRDENVRAAAAENLGKIGTPEAVPALLDALEGEDLWFRFTILEALAQIGHKIPAERLLAFRDQNLLRKALFECLGRVGGPEAIPALVEGLTDNMRNVRKAALIALVRIFEKYPHEVSSALTAISGTPAASAIADHLGGVDGNARSSAVLLLRLTGDPRFAENLLELLEDLELREEAAAALIAIGRRSAGSLTGLWPSADTRMRTYLAYVLGEAQCVDSTDFLLEGLSEPDPRLKQASIHALGRLQAISALDPLVESLKKESLDVREVAVRALSSIGSRYGGETLEKLRPLLQDSDPEVRAMGTTILGKLDSKGVTRLLSFAMKDDSAQVRRAAIRSIEGRAGTNQLQSLSLALTDEDSEVRRLAAETLGGTESPDAAPALELALRDEDVWVRAAAVRALGRLLGSRARPRLESAAADPAGLVGIAVLETLFEIEPENILSFALRAMDHPDGEVVNIALKLAVRTGRRDWVPPLVKRLLHHPNREVRLNFSRILAEIGDDRYSSELKNRLLLEEEETVREQLQSLLARPAGIRG